MNRLRMHMNIQIHFHCLLLCICNDHAIWNLKVCNVNMNIIVAVLFRIFLFVRKNTHRPIPPPRPITWQRASRFFQRLPHFGRTPSLFCQISRSCDLTASWKAPGSVLPPSRKLIRVRQTQGSRQPFVNSYHSAL